MKKQTKKGQIVIEFIWIIFFAVSFITGAFYLYDKSEIELKKYRMGRNIKYGKFSIFY